MTLGKTIFKGIIFVFTFSTWDLFFKGIYYDWIATQTGAVGFGQAALGYAIPFGFAILMTEILVRQLKLEGEPENREYQ